MTLLKHSQNIYNLKPMVITFDKRTTEQELHDWLGKVRDKRMKANQFKMLKYFGTLPDIGDGLQIQRIMRDEWD
ncbi:hypothetical protein FACS189451_06420 [Bacteroidia bacterium]|nr:hypothetical protein FACS189451_06420 [Bacteroidia bacterium]